MEASELNTIGVNSLRLGSLQIIIHIKIMRFTRHIINNSKNFMCKTSLTCQIIF